MEVKIFCFGLTYLLFLNLTCAPMPKPLPPGISEIYGTVEDNESGSKLPKVKARLRGYEATTFTDDTGNFSFKDLAAGQYTIDFNLSYYFPVTIRQINIGYGEHYKLDVRLKSISEGSDSLLDVKSGQGSPKFHAETTIIPQGTKVVPVEPSADFSPIESDHQRQIPEIKAATHNDNEEYPFYLDYLQRFKDIKDVYHRNFEDRLILRIVDDSDRPLFNVPFRIFSTGGDEEWKSLTYSNGENIIYPYILFSKAATDLLSVEIDYQNYRLQKEMKISHDRITVIKIPQAVRTAEISVDILFILDTTGSMGDEIQQLQDNIYSIFTRIHNQYKFLPLRFGLILYRDRGDKYLVQKFDFTESIEEFQIYLDRVESGGGGDNPEDIQIALKESLQSLSWSANNLKIAFLVADAPPHLDYDQTYTYLDAAKEANQRAIKLYTIGASGLDIAAEYVFRQIAVLSYGEFIFLTYGEKGESDGTDTGKVSHHTGDNYESHNLDDLVVNIVKKEISYQLPEEQIARKVVEPVIQEGHLKIRLDNLWVQIVKSLQESFDQEPVVVMAPIAAQAHELKELADYLYQTSMISLISTYRMKLVERDRLDQILTEKGLSLAGLIAEENYQELMQLLKSNIIFLGDLGYAGMDPVIFMRAVRTDTGQLLAAARIRL